MKEKYIVARNAFSITVDDALEAWQALQPRFAPFATSAADAEVLSVGIECGALAPCEAEVIYAPVATMVGVITARASRLPDGSLVFDFCHIDDGAPRLRMTMPASLGRADIVISPADDGDDVYFLTHALMIAFMLGTCHTGTLLIHASAVLYEGRAYLFQGKSGTGKSTHARMWTRHIAGARLLNDDHPVIRFDDGGVAMAYGSPWSGKTHCYRNEGAPIGGLVRIVRDGVNELQWLDPLRAYASLTASVFYLPFLSEELRTIRHRCIERLVQSVPCCAMHCRPDAEAARVCMCGLTNK